MPEDRQLLNHPFNHPPMVVHHVHLPKINAVTHQIARGRTQIPAQAAARRIHRFDENQFRRHVVNPALDQGGPGAGLPAQLSRLAARGRIGRHDQVVSQVSADGHDRHDGLLGLARSAADRHIGGHHPVNACSGETAVGSRAIPALIPAAAAIGQDQFGAAVCKERRSG